MAYSVWHPHVPNKLLRGTVDGIYNAAHGILHVRAIDSVTGISYPAKARLLTERFYTADINNIADLEGRQVEMEIINGQKFITKVLPPAVTYDADGKVNNAEPAIINVGEGNTRVDGNEVTVQQSGQGASISATDSEFNHGDFGLAIDDSGVAITSVDSAIYTLQRVPPGGRGVPGAFTFAREGNDPESGNLYQFLLVDTTQSVDEVNVYDSQNQIIGHVLRSEIAERSAAVLCHDSARQGGRGSKTELMAPSMLAYSVAASPLGLIDGEATYDWQGVTGATSYEGRTWLIDDTTPNILVGGSYTAQPSSPTTPGRTRQLFVRHAMAPYTASTFIDDDIRGGAHKPNLASVPIINAGGWLTTGATAFNRTRSLLLHSASAGSPVTATTADNGNIVNIAFTLPSSWTLYHNGSAVTTPSDLAGWQAILNKVRIAFYQVRAYNSRLHQRSAWSVPFAEVRIYLDDGYEWRQN